MRNEKGADVVLDLELTLIVPRIVVRFAVFGTATVHAAVPAPSRPAQCFVTRPSVAVQRTEPVWTGCCVSTWVTRALTTIGLPAWPTAGVTVGRTIDSVYGSSLSRSSSPSWQPWSVRSTLPSASSSRPFEHCVRTTS
jgi:hypothetical protein